MFRFSSASQNQMKITYEIKITFIHCSKSSFQRIVLSVLLYRLFRIIIQLSPLIACSIHVLVWRRVDRVSLHGSYIVGRYRLKHHLFRILSFSNMTSPVIESGNYNQSKLVSHDTFSTRSFSLLTILSLSQPMN